jgi:tetratricopeptide (TPR) repeat protein
MPQTTNVAYHHTLSDDLQIQNKKLRSAEDWQAYRERGYDYTELGEQEKAMSDLDKSLAMKETGLGHSYRGKVRLRTGDFNGAISDFERALQLQDEQLSVPDCAEYLSIARNIRDFPDDRLDYWNDLANYRPGSANANLEAGERLAERGLRRKRSYQYRQQGETDLKRSREFLRRAIDGGDSAIAMQAKKILSSID